MIFQLTKDLSQSSARIGLVFAVSLFVFAPYSHATTYILGGPPASARELPDEFVYEGRSFFVQIFPLEPYFKDHRVPLVFQQDTWAGFRRGYTARWEFVDGQLYLTMLFDLTRTFVDGEPLDHKKDVSPEIVFGIGVEYPVLAEWYSGEIKLVDDVFVKSGRAHWLVDTSSQKRTTRITVEKGKVVSVVVE